MTENLLKLLDEQGAGRPLKPPVDEKTLTHKQFVRGPFWQKIPAYAGVSEEQFLDHKWQAKSSITNVAKLLAAVQDLVSADFYADLEQGFKHAPMSVRISPYMLALIDWADPYRDPIRRQFVPLASRLLPDHPKLGLDSLGEQADAPVPGLTHRYTDKALFLPLDTCPVYCRFCTRSYAVGIDTEEVEKVQFNVNAERWKAAFDYVSSRPELEDIVISGGDAYNLRPAQIREIGHGLLDLSNVRRLRYATKGLAVMPQKILTDDDWVNALTEIVDKGRTLHKAVVLHTHFNHPNEITGITEDAMHRLFERGVIVRNQSVLLRGVNDDVDAMKLLVKKLGHMNVQPYYVYMHDLVKGVEDLRTTLQTAIDLEKHVRGLTAGFYTPTFVCDAPGGGGKRDVHSYEHYDRVTGISVFTAPSVKPGKYFTYFDPIDALPEEGQAKWADPRNHQKMIDKAIDRARAKRR
ncbi:MAG TPA: KamA family radical SAM protein [Haliangiales bacterium]|nr:KamA family radical SAM protein [Haliangiales bacterium]